MKLAQKLLLPVRRPWIVSTLLWLLYVSTDAKAFAQNASSNAWDMVTTLNEKNAQLWTLLSDRDKAIETLKREVSILRVALRDKTTEKRALSDAMNHISALESQLACGKQRETELEEALVEIKDDIAK